MAEEREPTLEQKRAADAWRCAANCNDKYVKLAKGLPALIMNSGLIQVLAYLQDKGTDKEGLRKKDSEHYYDQCEQLRAWLCPRFDVLPNNAAFDAVMNALMTKTDPQTFQDITAEAMAWLRWLRQIAPARCVDQE